MLTVILDTEFTDLKSKNPELISVGLALPDGRATYIEIAPVSAGVQGWHPWACSKFVVQTVWPLLERSHACTRAEAAKRIVDWLDSLNEPFELQCDFTGDWILVANLLNEYGLRMRNFVQVKLQRLSPLGWQEAEKAFAGGLRRHHSGDDAIAFAKGLAAELAYVQATRRPPGITSE